MERQLHVRGVPDGTEELQRMLRACEGRQQRVAGGPTCYPYMTDLQGHFLGELQCCYSPGGPHIVKGVTVAVAGLRGFTFSEDVDRGC